MLRFLTSAIFPSQCQQKSISNKCWLESYLNTGPKYQWASLASFFTPAGLPTSMTKTGSVYLTSGASGKCAHVDSVRTYHEGAIIKRGSQKRASFMIRETMQEEGEREREREPARVDKEKQLRKKGGGERERDREGERDPARVDKKTCQYLSCAHVTRTHGAPAAHTHGALATRVHVKKTLLRTMRGLERRMCQRLPPLLLLLLLLQLLLFVFAYGRHCHCHCCCSVVSMPVCSHCHRRCLSSSRSSLLSHPHRACPTPIAMLRREWVVGSWTLDTHGRWRLDAGHWTCMDAGHWTCMEAWTCFAFWFLLAVGSWTLDAGRWTCMPQAGAALRSGGCSDCSPHLSGCRDEGPRWRSLWAEAAQPLVVCGIGFPHPHRLAVLLLQSHAELDTRW